MVKEQPGKNKMNRSDNIHQFRKSRLARQNMYSSLNLPTPEAKREGSARPAKRVVQRQRRPNSRMMWPAVVLTIILIFSATFGLIASVSSRFALIEGLLTMMSTTGLMGETNLLIVGLDAGLHSQRTDTILVVHINPNGKKISAVSIQRDTLVEVPGLGLTKVNHAFAYGGMKLTKKTLERFLNVSIPFTVSIDIDGLGKVIDTLGGITLNVEKRMYYVDYAGGLYIDLYPGRQLMDGKKAIGYVRFRHDYQGDFGRISRQQQFVRALADKLISSRNVLQTPKLIMSLLSNIDTNMNSKQILGLSLNMRQAFDLGNIEMETIPGSSIMIDKVYYLRPDEEETRKIVTKLLMPQRKTSYVNDDMSMDLQTSLTEAGQ